MNLKKMLAEWKAAQQDFQTLSKDKDASARYDKILAKTAKAIDGPLRQCAEELEAFHKLGGQVDARKPPNEADLREAHRRLCAALDAARKLLTAASKQLLAEAGALKNALGKEQGRSPAYRALKSLSHSMAAIESELDNCGSWADERLRELKAALNKQALAARPPDTARYRKELMAALARSAAFVQKMHGIARKLAEEPDKRALMLQEEGRVVAEGVLDCMERIRRDLNLKVSGPAATAMANLSNRGGFGWLLGEGRELADMLKLLKSWSQDTKALAAWCQAVLR